MRVVVIGAGVGGLAVAIRLASAGHHVVVCEQGPRVGGKLAGYRRDGFSFDTGPTLLTMPGVFAELGVDLPCVPVPPVRYRFADGSSLEPGECPEWRRLLARAAKVWQVAGPAFVTSPLRGPADALRLALRHPGAVATITPWRTLRDVGRGGLRDPRLRMVLDRYATYTGSDPRRAPAALQVIPYLEERYGRWTLPGGLHTLADRLADRARDAGATLRTDARVTGLLRAGDRTGDCAGSRSGSPAAGRVNGVQLASGERLASDVVVSDVDARDLYTRLLARPRAARRLRRLPASASAFTLLLGVRGRTPGLAGHTVLFPADYDAEFDALFPARGHLRQPVRDPAIYVAVRAGPDMAPRGDEAWFVLVNAPAGDVDWDAPGLAAGYATRLLDLLAARGLDVRDRLAVTEWRTPADLARATAAGDGAIYGPATNGRQAAFRRAANVGAEAGLYCVGGSAHPGGGLPMVAISAALVAGLIDPAAGGSGPGTAPGRGRRRA